jgi:hypothetical protein
VPQTTSGNSRTKRLLAFKKIVYASHSAHGVLPIDWDCQVDCLPKKLSTEPMLFLMTSLWCLTTLGRWHFNFREIAVQPALTDDETHPATIDFFLATEVCVLALP